RLRAEEVAPRIVHHPSDVVVKPGNPARLSCRAEGSPQVSFEWLRNGQPLQVTKADGPMVQPMVLSEGSLFFLSVGEGRGGPSHEGVYACVARNAAGTAVSRNASLRIAGMMKEEFSVQPSDVEVAEGEVAVLNCGPPTGRPDPNVLWKKDGVPINVTDPHFTVSGSKVLSGKLIVAPAEKKNSGSYVCVAANTVGVRESRAARLSVLAKPTLLLKPENASVRLGESAQFYCQAKGDPPPTVVWSREQGPLPNGRYLVNPDQTLQIHYVTVQDAGTYTCTAANDVGVVTASAQLLVQEAASTEQKDLHKELSALRVDLENITIAAPGSDFSQVQWKLESLPSQPHYLDGFEVLYRSLLPAGSDWAAKKVTMPAFQCQLGPLKRGFKYEFKVRPYGSNLYGRESNTQHLRVPETVPSASPQTVSISVSHEQNNTIHLSWEPPPLDTHNGILQGYQVWCVESEEQQYQNWTVNSSQKKLDIPALKPGKQYWITIAAVNGAGVGVPSDPHGFLINPQKNGEPHSQNTVGLSRLVGEDLIIKHRMAAPDSPWMSGGWRPALSQKYQDLWADGYTHPGLRTTSLPVSTCKDPSCLDATVPMVTDSCGLYGTFYMDLMGGGLKTFNSPGRCPKMPHRLPQQQGTETIQIFPKLAAKSSGGQEALPWKQAIRPQPRMGVLRESWEKSHNKQGEGCIQTQNTASSWTGETSADVSCDHVSAELHAVNSVPILSTRTQTCSGVYNQRLSHIPPDPPGVDDTHEDTLTADDVGQYLELSPQPERCSVLPEERTSLSRLLSPALGYVSTHPRKPPASDEPEAAPVGPAHTRLRSTPSSCYSDWDSSLWSTWSSAMDGNVHSTRASLISSVDSCYTGDSTGLSRWLAAATAADSVSGASLSDFSPPASPLSLFYPSLRPDGDPFGEQERVPAWDWNLTWMGEAEAKAGAHRPARSSSRSFDV
ncbi:unnamed protein product, partial [Tetraodon nigroviridis]